MHCKCALHHYWIRNRDRRIKSSYFSVAVTMSLFHARLPIQIWKEWRVNRSSSTSSNVFGLKRKPELGSNSPVITGAVLETMWLKTRFLSPHRTFSFGNPRSEHLSVKNLENQFPFSRGFFFFLGAGEAAVTQLYQFSVSRFQQREEISGVPLPQDVESFRSKRRWFCAARVVLLIESGWCAEARRPHSERVDVACQHTIPSPLSSCGHRHPLPYRPLLLPASQKWMGRFQS